jgi:hypothetical protein
MIKRLIICTFLIVSVARAASQNIPDTLISVDSTGCEYITNNSTNLIMYFYTIQDFDSARIILDYWQTTCGISEPIVRTRILFSILENNFSETLYDSTIVDYVLNYMTRMDTTTNEDLYNDYKEYFGFVPIRGEYDYFTQCIADTLLQRIFYNPMELFYSECYANVLPDAVKEIQLDTIYNKTEFRSYYDQRVDKWKQKADLNLNFFTGIWIPTGNAALLGNHPVLGCQLGAHSQKMTYNLTLAFKLGKSKNEYTIVRDGNTETTDNFFGGYIGADIEREILKLRKNEFSILAGIGYDGFESVLTNTEDDNPDNDVGHSISSINTNFGLGYRHYLSNKSYIGLQGKYNFVNYANIGGTNLSGDIITISLFIGGFINEAKYYELNELRYVEAGK